MDKLLQTAKSHAHVIVIIACVGLLVMVIAGSVSSCSMMTNGMGNTVLGMLFTAEDEDLTGADADYETMEAELRRIFSEQYELTFEEEVEIRTRTETRTSTTSTAPVTGETTEDEYEVEVEYEYYILNVTMTNTSVDAVVRVSGLNADQQERYDVLIETRGNRDDLFGDVSFAVPGSDYLDYDILGEALTDEKFRNMINEAEKYLGYPYVWGGSSPSTSFDCASFVSYVINHCGNGWSVGRKTANGLMGCCDTIRKLEAKPGDLVFFSGNLQHQRGLACRQPCRKRHDDPLR